MKLVNQIAIVDTVAIFKPGQVHAGLWPACTWFLIIASVCEGL